MTALDRRLDQLDKTIGTRFSDLNNTVSAKIDTVNERIGALGTRVDANQEILLAKLATLEQTIRSNQEQVVLQLAVAQRLASDGGPLYAWNFLPHRA